MIHSDPVEAAFRAVDRRFFVPQVRFFSPKTKLASVPLGEAWQHALLEPMFLLVTIALKLIFLLPNRIG